MLWRDRLDIVLTTNAAVNRVVRENPDSSKVFHVGLLTKVSLYPWLNKKHRTLGKKLKVILHTFRDDAQLRKSFEKQKANGVKFLGGFNGNLPIQQ